jgi:hypothetical protein
MHKEGPSTSRLQYTPFCVSPDLGFPNDLMSLYFPLYLLKLFWVSIASCIHPQLTCLITHEVIVECVVCNSSVPQKHLGRYISFQLFSAMHCMHVACELWLVSWYTHSLSWHGRVEEKWLHVFLIHHMNVVCWSHIVSAQFWVPLTILLFSTSHLLVPLSISVLCQWFWLFLTQSTWELMSLLSSGLKCIHMFALSLVWWFSSFESHGWLRFLRQIFKYFSSIGFVHEAVTLFTYRGHQLLTD